MKDFKRSIQPIGTQQAKRIKLNAKNQVKGLTDKSGVGKILDCMERTERKTSWKIKLWAEVEQRKIALKE